MIMVNTHEAKTRLSSLLSAVENKRERVTICRGGRPVAILSALPEARDPFVVSPRLAKSVRILGDLTESLSPDDWSTEPEFLGGKRT